ncbi:hypothetical protein BGZ46_001230 [Entomortierella lignicola]|nr:hypothetical protein BGZ46_001230 [Entomortierella lignicola]
MKMRLRERRAQSRSSAMPLVSPPSTAMASSSLPTATRSSTSASDSQDEGMNTHEIRPSNKRRASTFTVDLKEPTFQFADTSPDSVLHAAFHTFRDTCRQLVIDGGGSLDFASQKAESLALNGIWYVGKALSKCSDARVIMEAMNKDFRISEFKEVMDLGIPMADILSGGNEQEITEAIDKLAAGELPWRARRALKIWRQLADTLPDEYAPGHQNGEQMFVNSVLQPFLSVTFSARGSKILSGNVEHDSGNEYKLEHAHGVRSDFFIVFPVRQLGRLGSTCVGLVGEAKPPEKVNSASLELKDQWKLFRMMKSEVDSQIKKSIKDPVVWGCQTFGYDITFYVMDLRVQQIYCLLKIFTATLPKSAEDVSSVARIISAFFHIEVQKYQHILYSASKAKFNVTCWICT